MIVNNYYQINETQKNLLNNGQNIIRQVLKKNDFAENIIKDLEREVEKRFTIFLNNKIPAINAKKLDDPENSIKYIMLKGLIKILDDLFYERMINLPESDKALIQSMLNNSNSNSNYNYMNISNNGPSRRNNSVGGKMRRNNYGINQNPSHYQVNPYNLNYQNRLPYSYQQNLNYRIDYNKYY